MAIIDKNFFSLSLTEQFFKGTSLTKYFTTIIESLPGRVYVKDINGVYIFCNEDVAKEFGFASTREIIGKTDFDLRPIEQAEILRKMDFQVMASGKPITMEESGTHLDGSSAVYSSRKIPFKDAGGNVLGVIGISIDITKEKQAEIAKDDFISNMEHDLRTPFAGISGIASTLYEIEDEPEKKEMLELVVKSCAQWEKTHHLILTVLSVKEPQIIERELFSLNSELSAIRDSLAATAYLKNLEFTITELPDKFDNIETDRLKFRLILSSLMGNAINFTEKGTIKVIPSVEGGNYKIQVIDTGIGIPEDKLDYIFEQFTKLSRSNKYGGNFKGVGLGLCISRHMAEQLGGSISVASQLGKGSIFTFILPGRTITS